MGVQHRLGTQTRRVSKRRADERQERREERTLQRACWLEGREEQTLQHGQWAEQPAGDPASVHGLGQSLLVLEVRSDERLPQKRQK